MTSSLVRLNLDDGRWHEFVASRPEATPLHLPSWGALLADCYGFKAFVLAAEEGGRLVAGLPVMEVRSAFRRPRWVSLPFTDECRPLGEPLLSFAQQLDQTRIDAGVGSFEVRSDLAIGHPCQRGYSHRLPLEADVDALLRRCRSSVRQGIRAAARQSVTVRLGETIDDLSRTFFRLHVRTRRRLGVPVQRRTYFKMLWERLIAAGNGFVLIAERDATPLAAAIFLHHNGNVLYKYGASDAAFWRLRANNALFYRAITHSVELGCQIFDWGRTDFEDEGLRRFKTNWGSLENELSYTTLGPARRTANASLVMPGFARELIRRSPSAVCRIAGALGYRYAA
jgi:CelD/BcsL family acetyltransferase involved in cellulose biosynthesis